MYFLRKQNSLDGGSSFVISPMKNINDSGIVNQGAPSSVKKAAAMIKAHTLFFISLNSPNYFVDMLYQYYC